MSFWALKKLKLEKPSKLEHLDVTFQVTSFAGGQKWTTTTILIPRIAEHKLEKTSIINSSECYWLRYYVEAYKKLRRKLFGYFIWLLQTQEGSMSIYQFKRMLAIEYDSNGIGQALILSPVVLIELLVLVEP